MKKAVFFGFTSGNCESIAKKITEVPGVIDVSSASQMDAAKIAAYEEAKGKDMTDEQKASNAEISKTRIKV